MRTVIAAVCLILAAVPACGSPETTETLEQLANEASPQRALKQVNAFLVANPDDYDGLLLKGYFLAQLGQREAAEKLYRKLARKYPDHPETYNNLAVLYANAGQYEKAAEILKQALGTHPSYSVAYENLGRVYGRSASEAYSRALGVEPPKEGDAEGLVMLKRSPREAFNQPALGQPALGQPALGQLAQRGSQREPDKRPPLPPSPSASNSPTEARRPSASQAPPPERKRPQIQNLPAQPPPTRQAQQERPVASAGTPALNQANDLREEIQSMVRSWAKAWSDQRASDYLAFYSSGYRPPEGLDRASWEKERRDRIQRPNTIRVVVRNLQAPVTTARGTSVTFVQSYSSDRFADKVTKTLVLVRENGEWKILEERADS